MLTLVFLAPAFATLALVLALVPFLVGRMVAQAEASYTPDLDSPEAWAASLDVALGEAWFDEAPMAPMAPMRARSRRHVVPTMLALTAPSPAPHVYTARSGKARRARRIEVLDMGPMTLRSAA